MKKKKGSLALAVMAVLVASVNCILNPSKDQLAEISLQGEKYLDGQIENAVNGVKEMKSLMQKSSDDRKKFLEALEKTKEQKEDAMRTAQEMEAKLVEEEEVCNETMKALWEECKPCLKNTCVKYYSRTCSSGSGLVGRQVRPSPINTLEQEGQRQSDEFSALEEKYTEMADSVDSIFSDSMKVAEERHSSPLSFYFPRFMRWDARRRRSYRSLFGNPFRSFHRLFMPLPGMERDKVWHGLRDGFFSDGSVNEDVVITKPFGRGRMTCREIRRNSAGCLMFRDECQKCRDIQHIDCSGRKPLEGPLKGELEEALALAERFTQQYTNLLRRFEERMANTSYLLDLLNRQFGWVSSLANRTNSKDNTFQVQTVMCRDNEDALAEQDKQPVDTKVSVRLFDSPPMNFTVPGDIAWSDPKFPEVVVQTALGNYKESSVYVSRKLQ
uniref:Clusterin n=1 Tax=Mola mola TaxID=94237 RepID=A0A3Q4BJZ2_MOLML